MTRIRTNQAATNQPTPITVAGVPTDWTTVLEAPDFSLPDPNERFPDDRDPAETATDKRRIASGQALLETPLMFHNRDTTSRWVEIRTIREDGTTVVQAKVTIPPGDTYLHPSPGQTLVKQDLTSSNGDQLQVRAQSASVVDLIAGASVGMSEKHLPDTTGDIA